MRIELPRAPAGLPPAIERWTQSLTRALEQRLSFDRRYGLLRYSNFNSNVEPEGTKNSSNTDFAVQFRIARNEDGTPLAFLFLGTTPLLYTTSATPGTGFWTIDDSLPEPERTAIVLGDAPGASDTLVFAYLISD